MRYPSGRLLVSVASIVLAVTACTTSRTEAPVLPTSIPPPTSATSPQDISDPSTDGTNGADLLPIDQEVRKGELDNGLTYYLRHNDSPGRRAELRLLVNAGSVQEDEDQAGVAHFLEHMMFNGTEQFPRNELIAALESFGPRFGPDINAFTTYDETIYELSLSSDNEELIDLGVEVLREWASLATLTEHSKHPAFQIDIVPVQRYQLAHSEAGCVQELEHRAVSALERFVTGDSFEKRFDFAGA